MPFPFMRLPRELRDKIYEHALVSQYGFIHFEEGHNAQRLYGRASSSGRPVDCMNLFRTS